MSVRKNTVINMAGAVVPTLVMLVTVPPYLRLLGEDRYGVLALVWLMLGYFGFLEMGLGKATANQIARAHDAPAEERSEIFWSALLLNATMGCVGALILWVAGKPLLTHLLTRSPADFRQEVMETLPWMSGTLPLALVSSVLTGALEGRSRFFAVNVLQVASNLLFQSVPLTVAYFNGPDLSVVIPTAIGVKVLMNVPFFIVCHRVLPLSLVPRFSLQRARSLFSFGGWVAITGIISPIMETADRFLIGVVTGARAVTHYTVGVQLATKVRILPASLTRALFPSFSAATDKGEELALSALSVLVGLMTPITVVGLLLIRPFETIWLGESVATHAIPVTQIILVGVWANSLAYIPYNFLQGSGRPGHVAKLHLAEALPFLALLYGATSLWGARGAAVAWATRVAADSALLFTLAGIGRAAARRVALPMGIVFLALFACGLESYRWVHLGLAALLVLCVFAWTATTPVGDYVLGQLRRRAQRQTVTDTPQSTR
ncbi:MAG: flippase [Myxococcaceae bacterium]|nr:flippase [Myxococcaceae bacterium]